mmetsp:Transcript_11580/g.28534  ORF Transcript_11580/g.28534 Transcript_11580/m.28534 type:complete len:473 (-) Transcript_11580:444-1862(-)|eukprot:CAMPEP_0114522342 /NCGR_PEP_ID=MMETSP0109-20121206/20690_1 /TAXON_ID=29199 /ORGANISM="Chlorarachnion reptans, Strain CCCM449" /LENGTH=472 /DNA_ID=CAMNT_0001703551 /DNA_START=28 /DNA_END=1446 /DNA_ORIENTATION=+
MAKDPYSRLCLAFLFFGNVLTSTHALSSASSRCRGKSPSIYGHGRQDRDRASWSLHRGELIRNDGIDNGPHLNTAGPSSRPLREVLIESARYLATSPRLRSRLVNTNVLNTNVLRVEEEDARRGNSNPGELRMIHRAARRIGVNPKVLEAFAPSSPLSKREVEESFDLERYYYQLHRTRLEDSEKSMLRKKDQLKLLQKHHKHHHRRYLEQHQEQRNIVEPRGSSSEVQDWVEPGSSCEKLLKLKQLDGVLSGAGVQLVSSSSAQDLECSGHQPATTGERNVVKTAERSPNNIESSMKKPSSSDRPPSSESTSLGTLIPGEHFWPTVKNSEPSVIAFGVRSCRPCKYFEPRFKKLAAKFEEMSPGRFTFRKLFRDSDEQSKEIFDKFEITHTPTFIIFQNGQSIGRYQGISETKLQRAIEGAVGIESSNQNNLERNNERKDLRNREPTGMTQLQLALRDRSLRKMAREGNEE